MSNRKELALLYRNANKEVIACPICENAKYTVVGDRDRYFLPVQTVSCDGCSFVYTNPRPDEEWFVDFYRSHYRYLYEGVDVIDAEYLSRSDIISKHDNNIEFLNRYLCEGSGGCLLDIGSAEGLFLRKFKSIHDEWNTVGVEPSELFSEYSKSYSNSDKIINDVYPSRLLTEKFDVIHSSHVLEHVHDLNSFIVSIKSNLKDDGLLFIDVPNIDSSKTSFKLIHIAHLYHFSVKSLTMLLNKHGFEIIDSKNDMCTVKPNGKLGTAWTLQVLAKKTGRKIEPVFDCSFNIKEYQKSLAEKIKPGVRRKLKNFFGIK